MYALIKPKGMTSHDVVDAVRRITGERKVGHAGTLDPLASGVLVVAVGRPYTKKIDREKNTEKEYVAEVTLGATSTTDDAEGELHAVVCEKEPLRQDVVDATQPFVGIIDQVPPVYSAIKIKGTPAHRRVRRGEKLELEPRKIEVVSIEVEEYAWPTVVLRIVCGPGTYIRSLARDIGDALGTGGYISELRRTRVGLYEEDEALTLEQFEEMIKNRGT